MRVPTTSRSRPRDRPSRRARAATPWHGEPDWRPPRRGPCPHATPIATRQPPSAPRSVTRGTPTTSESDCPVMTQPSARPRWARGHAVGDGREDRSHEATAADSGEELPDHGGPVAVGEGEAEPGRPEREHGGDEHRPPADPVGGRPGRDGHHAPADAHHGDQVGHGRERRAEIARDVEQERGDGDRGAGDEERHHRERHEHAPRERRRRHRCGRHRRRRSLGRARPAHSCRRPVGVTRSIVPSAGARRPSRVIRSAS